MEPSFLSEEIDHRAIKVLVVGELHMPANVPSKALGINKGRSQTSWLRPGLDQLPV